MSYVIDTPIMTLDSNMFRFFHDDGSPVYGQGMLKREFARMHDMLMEEMQKLRERDTSLTVPEQDQLHELFSLMLKLQVAAYRK